MTDAPNPGPWRCFHCDEIFTEYETALEHFGPHPFREPACKIDIVKFREMEANHETHNAEDSAMHREIYALTAKHNSELRRQEEIGYARGLRDANHMEPQ